MNDSNESTIDAALASATTIRQYSDDFADYEQTIVDFVWPTEVEWASVPIFILLLAVGLVGNSLVVFVVIRNQQMRTCTNIFLVNLALADFLVLLFCLPFSVLWDITKTWWFGSIACKGMLFLQTLSVTVSVLTLVCISIERWYAICYPLHFKITLKWTVNLLAIVWLTGLACSVPEAYTVTSLRRQWLMPNFTTPWLATCSDQWGESTQRFYQLATSILLFVLPLAVISFMYGQIAYVLWVKAAMPPGEYSTMASDHRCHPNRFQPDRSSTAHDSFAGAGVGKMCVGSSSRPTSGRCQQQVPMITSEISIASQRQPTGRRKAAKMLIAVVILFAICYMPVHVYNILRAFNLWWKMYDKNMIAAVKFLIRFLTYSNSCCNPILYNFMSEKFRREFRRAFTCRHSRRKAYSAIDIRQERWSKGGGGDNNGRTQTFNYNGDSAKARLIAGRRAKLTHSPNLFNAEALTTATNRGASDYDSRRHVNSATTTGPNAPSPDLRLLTSRSSASTTACTNSFYQLPPIYADNGCHLHHQQQQCVANKPTTRNIAALDGNSTFPVIDGQSKPFL